MKNNAHIGETKEHRLKRFQDSSGIEIIDTLLSSMATYFVNELKSVFNDPSNYQTSLMFLGTHSIALTLAHGLFNKHGEDGYKIFLENFIDGDTDDTKFSTIAFEIHEWRNVIAHRWLNVAGHEIGYDFDMNQGWFKNDDVIFINPKIYLDQYLKAFGRRGKIYNYMKILNTEEKLEMAKNRFLSKYTEEA